MNVKLIKWILRMVVISIAVAIFVGCTYSSDKSLWGNDYYVNKNGQVYLKGDGFVYLDDILSDVDAKTFAIIKNSGYIKDKNAIFAIKADGAHRWASRVDGADMSSFAGAGGSYGKDRNHVFFEERIVESADPSTFVAEEQDAGVGYAKDKQHVFFEDRTISDRPNSFRLIFPPSTGYFSSQGSVVSDFYYYATDDDKVFLNGKKIDGADPITFEVPFRGVPEIARDAHSIYLSGVKMYGVDVGSFVALEGSITANGYAKDNNHVYFFGYDFEENLCIDKLCVIETADPKTFVIQKEDDRYVAKDASHYFRDGAVVEK